MKADRPTKPAGTFSIRHLLVIWMMVISAVSCLDRAKIAIAGVEIGKEFHIDNTPLGWIFSAFLAGYAAFQIPAEPWPGVLARGG